MKSKTSYQSPIVASHLAPSAEFYLRLGHKLAGEEKLAEAISAYTKALELQPERAEIYAALGHLYSLHKRFKLAIDYYQQALARQPHWSEAHYNLGIILQRLGNWPGATQSYQQAIALKPDYSSAYFNLALLYERQGQLEAAEENYRSAINFEPENIRAYTNLGCVLAKQKHFEAAIEAYQQALELEPDSATLHNNLGQIWLIEKHFERAIAAFHRALELEPELALAHRNLGRLWVQQGDYEEAVPSFQQAIALEPDDLSTYGDCGNALLIQGKFAEAMECFRQAIAQQPAFVAAFCQRSELFDEQDLFDRAKLSCIHFLNALQNSADYSEIRHYLTHSYKYLGDVLSEYGGLKQAEFIYQRALQIQADDVDLYLRLGNCLAKQERLDAAIAIYHAGLTLQPIQPQISFHLGSVLAKKGRLEQALGYYENVLQLQLQGQGGEWGDLPAPTLAPFSAILSQLPQGIYRFSQDWIEATDLEGCQYLEVIWDKQKTRFEEQRQPEAPLEPSSGENSADSPCGGVTCTTCMPKLCRRFEPMSKAKGVFFCSRQEVLAVESPPTFVVTIPQGRAWIAPQQNSWMICKAMAIITPDGYLLGDLSRNYPWFLPGCQRHDPTRHSLFSLETLPPKEEIDGTVAILSTLSGQIYYHWLIDLLPRIGILRQSGLDFEQIDWFVVNNVDKSFQRETLEVLGIPAQKILPSDRHPHLQAKRLVVPSFPGHLDWIPPGTLEFLRQTFLTPDRLKVSGYPERIYISRARAKYRHLINEAQVRELLSELGFVTVFLEEMSVVEQVALFASARAIVAPHGSGLTNLVFCNPGTKLIELFSPNYVRSDYWIVSNQLGIEHYYLKGKSFECYPIRQLMYQTALTEDILINLEFLKSALEVAGLTGNPKPSII